MASRNKTRTLQTPLRVIREESGTVQNSRYDDIYDEMITGELQQIADEWKIHFVHWDFFHVTEAFRKLVDKKLYSPNVNPGHCEATKMFLLLGHICILMFTEALEEKQMQLNLRAYVKSFIKHRWMTGAMAPPNLQGELALFADSCRERKLNEFMAMPHKMKQKFLMDSHCDRLCQSFLHFPSSQAKRRVLPPSRGKSRE